MNNISKYTDNLSVGKLHTSLILSHILYYSIIGSTLEKTFYMFFFSTPCGKLIYKMTEMVQ